MSCMYQYESINYEMFKDKDLLISSCLLLNNNFQSIKCTMVESRM